MPGALDDIRVIDFTHALNGPFCTMMLGHMGAEIIKIEPPAGDGFRRSWMPPGSKVDGYEFLWVSVNKKSVVLNLKDPRGADLARQLIAKADVVVENYHTGTMEKFGLGYEDLKKINPRIIYSCSRGFGESGPYKDYGSTAHTNNSMTGWTHTGWGYNKAPGTKAIGIGDEAAGVSMVCGILAALHARERTGEGQRIVVSMQEALMGFMISEWHEHFIGIEIGNKPVPAADGYFTLRVPDLSDRSWAKLTKLMGRDDLLQDARFATDAARKQNRSELYNLVKAWVATKTAPGALERPARHRLFRRAGIVDGRGDRRSPYQRTQSVYRSQSSDSRAGEASGALDSHVEDAGKHSHRLARDWAAHRRSARWNSRFERG